MRYGLTLVTAPTGEPVGVDEVKKQVELPQSDINHDVQLGGMIKAARILLENETNRALYTQTWDLYLDNLPFTEDEDEILLPKAPLQSISSFNYTDGDGAAQVWAASNYVVSTSREPGRITRAYGISWPTARYTADSIRIRFVCGYGGTKETVNELARECILMMVADWFLGRAGEGEITPWVKRMLTSLNYGDEFASYAPMAVEA